MRRDHPELLLMRVTSGLYYDIIPGGTSPLVLTLDSFLTMGRQLRAKIIEEANRLAEKDGAILAEYRRHIVFCPIPSLEAVLSVSIEDTFLALLDYSPLGDTSFGQFATDSARGADRKQLGLRHGKRFAPPTT